MGKQGQLNQIEAVIATLKQEKTNLERRLALLHIQQDFLDEATQLYFDLWRLKWESGLDILKLSPVHSEFMENLFGRNVVAQQTEAIEAQLSRLISKGRSLTLSEIEGMIPVIDGIIEELKVLKGQFAKREQSALSTVKSLAGKVSNIAGGVALIDIDLPILELTSIIGGSLLILNTARSHK